MKHKILELYSGIGGMHCAWNGTMTDVSIYKKVLCVKYTKHFNYYRIWLKR